ncbi:MAG: FAD-containing oxidoreductase [Gemmatimonadetes bacterium]|jgi:pyruvate/2-oxoglutarate dehydrogenase complex dihydrolipoamide dehydrogenase (E3) component|nr:FAD-containing oxidoreductase [Gemmatimonadota bacterium]MBT7862769.1 FAD-containing oxidoreductase [Gemmatimonadota bacterium]
MERFDAIIIGTGQAGPSLADRLNDEGQRVAIIERGLVGGTCVNVGCVPTKALVASARVAHVAGRAAEFGINLGAPFSVDMKKVKARKDEISGSSNRGLTAWLEGLDHVTLIRGHARFEGPKTIRVEDRVLAADKIFLNVGGRAFVPPIPGIEDVDVMTNVEMMALDTLPEHLVIVGGSYISLEFAQMYRRFGSQVTVVEMSERIIPREDEDVSQTIREILEGEGVRFENCSQVSRIEATAGGFIAHLEQSDGELSLAGSHLLMAVGRKPNTDDLGLDTAGVELDPRGYVVVDDQLQTTVAGIWALGDCNGQGAFTHTSYNDFEIVAANLFDDDPRRVSDRIMCYGLFTDPPLGRVGMTEQQARESGRKVLMGKRLMANVGRARERSETAGFIKVLVDADTKQVLGAAILGINGDEVVHILLDIMYARAPYTVIQRAMHIHPTVAELIPTVLGDLEPLQ